MKTRIFILTLMLAAGVAMTAEAKKEKKEKNEVAPELRARVDSLVNSERFIISFQDLASQGGDVVSIPFGSFLDVAKNVGFMCNMPAFTMKGAHKNYTMAKNRKGNYAITFGASATNYYYTFDIEILPDGRASVHIVSNADKDGRRMDLWGYGELFFEGEEE